MTAWFVAAASAVVTWCVLVPAGPFPWRVVELHGPTRANRRRVQGARAAHGRAPAVWLRLRRPRRRAAGSSDLVEVIDRLHVAVSAGHSLHTAVHAVAELGDGPSVRALAAVAADLDRGVALVEALERLVDDLGGAAAPLVAVLTTSLRSGADAAPALQRLADAERRRTRRRAEAKVRRLPVLLLAPLVGLVLPSFVLVTIVPVAVTTARAGLLPASP